MKYCLVIRNDIVVLDTYWPTHLKIDWYYEPWSRALFLRTGIYNLGMQFLHGKSFFEQNFYYVNAITWN